MVKQRGNWRATLRRLRLCNDLYCGVCISYSFALFLKDINFAIARLVAVGGGCQLLAISR